MPVQSEAMPLDPADERRGWTVYRRDRNFEVFPNSRPAPGEKLERITITAAPGEIESEPFSVYTVRDQAGIAVAPSIRTTP